MSHCIRRYLIASFIFPHTIPESYSKRPAGFESQVLPRNSLGHCTHPIEDDKMAPVDYAWRLQQLGPFYLLGGGRCLATRAVLKTAGAVFTHGRVRFPLAPVN